VRFVANPKAADELPRRCSTISGGFPPRRRGLRKRERSADHLNPWRSLLAPHAGSREAGPAMHECMSFAASSGDSVASPPRGPLHRGSVSDVHSRSPCRNKASSAPRCHPHGSRSALVVSHHLDGFLRPHGADIVAVRCRSWGSPCFLTTPPDRALPKEAFQPAWPFPTMHTPLEGAPCLQRLLPHHDAPKGLMYTVAAAPLPFRRRRWC
jgi:hypothetical protein